MLALRWPSQNKVVHMIRVLQVTCAAAHHTAHVHKSHERRPDTENKILAKAPIQKVAEVVIHPFLGAAAMLF